MERDGGVRRKKGGRRRRGREARRERRAEEEEARDGREREESAVGRGRRPIRNVLCAFIRLGLPQAWSKCPVAVVE